MNKRKFAIRVPIGLLVVVSIVLILLLGGRVAAQDEDGSPPDDNLPINDNRPRTSNRPQAGAGIYDEGEWLEIGSSSALGGGISNNIGESWAPSIAVVFDGSPTIAWMDESRGAWETYVRRWNGTSWSEMGSGSATGGGISNTDADSRVPSLAVGSDGAPIIAYQDHSDGDYEIYVRRWNGSSWAEMGSGSASGGGISNNSGNSYSPYLIMGSDGAPIVAWYDYSGDSVPEIYIRRWNGSSWVQMGSGSASGGGISNNSGGSRYPSLVVGADGAPIIAWHDDSAGDAEIYVRRWNGSSWVEMGSDSASGGGISNGSESSRRPRLVIGPDDTPIVAWYDYSSGVGEIYVRRWNGSSWVEMGSGSASGGGISNTGNAYRLSMAVGSDSAPIIAWEDSLDGDYEIYVRRWNGSSWVEMGGGSASGGGISNNSGRSTFPSLAVGSDGAPIVAWYDFSGDGIGEIYVRRWEPDERFVFLPVSLSGSYYFAPMIGSQETEPNDKWHQANGVLETGKIYHGGFSSSADSNDYYYFYQARIGSSAIKLSDIPAGQNYDLVLRDSNLVDVGYSGELNNDDELIIENLTPGVYYIQVYNRDSGSHAGQYSLQAVFEE